MSQPDFRHTLPYPKPQVTDSLTTEKCKRKLVQHTAEVVAAFVRFNGWGTVCGGLLPVSLQQQVAGQSGFSLGRSLNGADVGSAIVKERDIRQNRAPVSLFIDQGIGSADRQVNYVGYVPAYSWCSRKVPMQ